MNIWGNIEGKVELNQRFTQCKQIADRAVSAIFRTAYHIKMKLLGHHVWDVQMTKRQHVTAITAMNTAATAVTTTTNIVLLLLLVLLLLSLLL